MNEFVDSEGDVNQLMDVCRMKVNARLNVSEV
jgi:hypothetical protein